MRAQLRQLFENPEDQQHLDYRTKRMKINEDAIEDIFDGLLYKSLSKPGQILHSKWNFSYTFNTDGTELTVFDNTAGWPVYIVLNELPPALRTKHIILAAIWVDKEKPLMNEFLKPFVSHMNDLAVKGVTWKTADNQSKVRSFLLFPVWILLLVAAY